MTSYSSVLMGYRPGWSTRSRMMPFSAGRAVRAELAPQHADVAGLDLHHVHQLDLEAVGVEAIRAGQ